MPGPDVNVWLVAVYVLVMLAVAWAVDVLGSRSARRSMNWRHADFVYHDDVDGWRCHEDQWLWPTAFDPDKRVLRYEGAHALLRGGALPPRRGPGDRMRGDLPVAVHDDPLPWA